MRTASTGPARISRSGLTWSRSGTNFTDGSGASGALTKVTNRRTNVVEGVGDRDIRKGTNGKVVELHYIPNEHSDGMLAVYLPAEKVLWTADITIVNPNPNQLGVVKSAATALTRPNLDYNAYIPAHPPNPDKALTKSDFQEAASKN